MFERLRPSSNSCFPGSSGFAARKGRINMLGSSIRAFSTFVIMHDLSSHGLRLFVVLYDVLSIAWTFRHVLRCFRPPRELFVVMYDDLFIAWTFCRATRCFCSPSELFGRSIRQNVRFFALFDGLRWLDCPTVEKISRWSWLKHPLFGLFHRQLWCLSTSR